MRVFKNNVFSSVVCLFVLGFLHVADRQRIMVRFGSD